MTVSIPNGFVTPLTTLDLYRRLTELKPKVTKAKEYIVGTLIDAWLTTDPASREYSAFMAYLVSKGMPDLSYSILLFPQGNKTLLLLPRHPNVGYLPCLHTQVIAHLKAKEYRFWNDENPHPRISARRWAQRKKDWDAAFAGLSKTDIPEDYALISYIVRKDIPLTTFTTLMSRKETI